MINLDNLKPEEINNIKQISTELDEFTTQVQLLQQRLQKIKKGIDTFYQQGDLYEARTEGLIIKSNMIKEFDESWKLVNSKNTWSFRRRLKKARDSLISLQR